MRWNWDRILRRIDQVATIVGKLVIPVWVIASIFIYGGVPFIPLPPPAPEPQIELDTGLVYYIVKEDLASGIPLLAHEERFLAGIGVQLDDVIEAMWFYEDCFETRGFPSMDQVFGRFVLDGLASRPPGPGEYTITPRGIDVAERMNEEVYEPRRERLVAAVSELCVERRY